MRTPNEILKKIENALSIQELPKALQIIRDNALENKKRQVKDILDIINIPKYKIVFIGAIGSGKTTAISHIFNLTNTVQVTKTIGKGKKKTKKKIKVVRELMTVGVGGTTIAEVVMKSTDEEYSFFKINFISENELIELVDSFCEQVINKENKNKAGRLMSQEEERAFRNILNLKPIGTDLKPELQILKDVENDEIKFKDIIYSRIENVTKETSIKIAYTSETNLLKENRNVDEKAWINKVFEKINVADIENFSIPKQIELHLTKNILGENNPLIDFNSIIDTKGLDAARDKKSIDDYLKEEDTVCIFTTRYAVAPDEKITHFIEKHLQDDLKNTHHRFIVLMLPRDDEPEKVIGYDGKAMDDWDEGIEYRKEVIKNQFSGLGIEFSKKNILHFDAFRYFENGLPEKEYTEDIKDDKDTIINRIQDRIVYRQKMEDLILKFDKSIDTIVNGKYDEKVLDNIKILIQKIRGYQKLIIDINFAQEFINKFDNNYWHWATKHAINKRHGVWEWKDIDLAYDGKELVEAIIKRKTIDYKSRINEIIIEFGNNDTNNIYKSISEHLQNEFLGSYNKFVNIIKIRLNKKLSENEFQYHSNLWHKVLDESIKGAGFVYRMLQVYRTELSDIKNYLKEQIEILWKDEVINNILNFLGEEELKKKTMNNLEIPYIEEIQIKNYFSIDEEGIQITGLANNKEIYFVGENGSGKTILLQAIALSLKGNQNIGAINDIVKQNFKENYIFKAFDNISENEYSSETKRTYNFLYGYGINRLVFGNEKLNKDDEVYASLFNNKYSLIHPVSWLQELKLELYENENKFITLETVSDLLSDFLEKEVKVYLKGSEVIFEERNTPLSFEQLSDGYKSSITWISDLLARLSFHQPDAKTLSDFRGVVMVDEIGIYLHPKLKFALIRKLRTKFSSIQWIFTTHSPITLLGASKNAIVYKVYKEKDTGTTRISKPINISGYTANSLITSTIWNVPDFATEGTELEMVSNVDNIYKNIHKLVSEQQQSDPSFDENDLVAMIKNELSKNN